MSFSFKMHMMLKLSRLKQSDKNKLICSDDFKLFQAWLTLIEYDNILRFKCVTFIIFFSQFFIMRINYVDMKQFDRLLRQNFDDFLSEDKECQRKFHVF